MTDILQLASSGQADSVLRDMRVRALYSPFYFIRTVLGYRKLVAHLHHHDLELFVTRWSQGVLKQFIEWPRAFYKTTTFTIGCSIWHVLPVCDEDSEYAIHALGLSEEAWFSRVALHDQDATQLLAFETETNAIKKIQIIREHFESNEIFRALFPEILPTGNHTWSSHCLIIPRVGARKRDAEGTFEAIGVGVAVQSRHYKTVWEDDLVGERARQSPPQMEKTIGWHSRLAGAFESGARQNRFGISNRWGYADLNSAVRENEPDFVFYTRAAWEIDSDPESETFGKDIAIFPEEYSIEALCAIRDSGSMTRYDFSCQYLNEPVMPGEAEVDDTKIHTYTVTEDGTMKCSCGACWRLSQCNRYLHYDPYNAKGAGSTSCPALVLVATAPDEHVFVVSYFTTKASYGKIYDKIFWYNDTFRPKLFTYEDVGHQNAGEFHIKEISRTTEYKAKHKNFCRIESVPTGNRSKEARIREGIFPIVTQKKFSIRDTHQQLLKQFQTFPHKTLHHDYDLLDALSQGSTLWRFPEREEVINSRSGEEDEYLKHFNEPYGYSGRLIA